ncbi:MAG TPA: ABC transporter ATP-binding protein, partial [Anaerolineae bacterium]|nr:ABC transporter ATP-binding protein [Anaerolineae bacterium]
GTLEETISGVRVIQAFSREEHNSRHFREVVNQDYFDANVHAAWLSAIFFPTVDFIGYAAVAIVVAVGGMAVLGQTLTAGVLVAFILYIERFFDPIRELAQRYNTLQATMAAGERIFHLLDTEPDIITSPGAIRLPRIRGHVRFENVYFSYDEQVPVLQGINLEVLPGQMVAFVGATGAGKSSLVKLLGRFYDIQSGRLTIDGYDVRDVDLASLRSQMGIVLQETFLFGGTVMDNIRYGRLDASDEEVMDAAKAVGAHEFIQSLSHGYYTEVEEGGAILSVGQRQLLAFARALLADPRIIILDEATSSIDTKTERLIQAAMGRLLAGRTAFVVAHRLSTIVHADQIVVLDQGRIVEQGTHAELIMRRGLYYRLYTMSFQHFSVPTAALGKAEDGNGRQTGS